MFMTFLITTQHTLARATFKSSHAKIVTTFNIFTMTKKMLYDMHWLEVTQGLNPRSDYRQDDNNPSNESGIDHSVKVK